MILIILSLIPCLVLKAGTRKNDRGAVFNI